LCPQNTNVTTAGHSLLFNASPSSRTETIIYEQLLTTGNPQEENQSEKLTGEVLSLLSCPHQQLDQKEAKDILPVTHHNSRCKSEFGNTFKSHNIENLIINNKK
jgi:hypothetical protein